MKRLALLLVLTSTSAYAQESFYGPNGEHGFTNDYGNGYKTYHSDRGDGSSTTYGSATFYRGYGPGSGGHKPDSRTDPLD